MFMRSLYICGTHIALVLFDASRWPIEIIKHNFFDIKDCCLLTKGAITCGLLA